MIYKRTLYEQLIAHEKTDKITLLVWARQVGKSTLMKQCIEHWLSLGKSVFRTTLERYDIKNLLDANPENIFQLLPVSSEKLIVCIDEIQYLKNPTNFLKLLYDEHRDRIKLFVTWSSSFYIDRHFKDSLAGRKKVFTLYPLTFQEFLLFKDKEWLENNLINKPIIDALFAEYLTYGGYPELVLSPNSTDKEEYLLSLVSTYIQKDITEAGVRYPEKYFQLLQLLASQTGKLVNMNELSNVLWISVSTVQDYLYIMQKSFHIWLLKPFSKNIRKEIIRMPKVYFFDAGIRNYCLRNYQTLWMRNDKWDCLEQYVRQYLHQKHQWNINYWHDKSDHEVDFIIQQTQAREVKWNSKLFKPSSYTSFTNSYPQIPLECVDHEKMLALSCEMIKKS